jgi:hypothetical protein
LLAVLEAACLFTYSKAREFLYGTALAKEARVHEATSTVERDSILAVLENYLTVTIKVEEGWKGWHESIK